MIGCEEEKWLPIPGYPHYEASNLGRIRSIDKEVRHNYGGVAIKKGKVLSQYLNKKGYLTATVTENGKTKGTNAHIFIALAWHPNPENKPTVNHKDAVKTNNCEWNLEWATQREQVLHAIKNNCRKSFKLSESTKRSISERGKKRVMVYNTKSRQQTMYDSINDAAAAIGVIQSAISKSLSRNSLVLKKYKVSFAIDKTKL